MKSLAEKMRLVLSACLFALSFLTYLAFQTNESTILVLLGLGLFVCGFYVGMPASSLLRRFKPVFPLVVFVILGEWFFFTDNLTSALLGSPYATLLTGATTWVTTHLLNGVGIRAVQSNEVILLTSPAAKLQSVSIAAACSGAEGSLLFVAAAGLMVVDYGRRAPKGKLLVSFLAGAACVYALTLLRVPVTILVGYFYGVAIMETFHLYAGMLMFLGAIVAYWWLSLRWFSLPTSKKA